MSTASSSLVNKLWNYCNILRDDGLSYGDYVEQLTFLLFLKMAHERTQPPYNQPPIIPVDYNWLMHGPRRRWPDRRAGLRRPFPHARAARRSNAERAPEDC